MRAFAGALAFGAAAQWLLLVIVAEAQYPNYTTQRNFLSDLGATCHRGLAAAPCVVVFPAAPIWNATLSLLGLLSLISAVLMVRATRARAMSGFFGAYGLGALIAGVVPETLLAVHELASLAAFIAGGVAAILAFRKFSSPLRQFSLALGVIALLCVIPLTFQGPFYRWNDIFGLGLGGVERMVVYPIIIWQLALGASLMGETPLATRATRAEKQLAVGTGATSDSVTTGR
jgi:hypothetical membrane protein